MNRLQKKCLIATAGLHLLLVVILIVGPGFFRQTPKPDNTQLLDVIPANAIEAALTSGVKNAQPPPPTPAPAQPMIEPPKPVVIPTPTQPQPTPPAPAPAPTPPDTSLMDKVKNFFKPEPAAPMPTPDDSPKPVEHKKHTVNVDLTTVQRTTVEKPEKPQPHHTSEESKLAARERAKEINNVVRNLENNFTSSTKVEMPGTSSVSYASYASIIKSIYTREWQTPANAANDQANVKVSVTVSSDGTVVSAHIVDPSGDASVDDSVQHTLDHVTFIAPFPEGATEKEKTFIINFNLKAKRMLG